MARPCCKAKVAFPQLHGGLVGTAKSGFAENYHWFRYMSRLIVGTVGVDDADVIAEVGYRHDRDGAIGMNFFTGFIADHLQMMQKLGSTCLLTTRTPTVRNWRRSRSG